MTEDDGRLTPENQFLRSAMSQPITVTIPHRLGRQEAARRLRSGLGTARDQFGLLFTIRDEVWNGDRLDFKVSSLGQEAQGSVQVEDDRVVLNVLLSGLLGRFADTIRSKLKQQATLMLEKK